VPEDYVANRFVLVDETGRVYDRTGVEIKVVEQDCGRTVKVFLLPYPNDEEQKQLDVAEIILDFRAKRYGKGLNA
jgi:hypothetical protein